MDEYLFTVLAKLQADRQKLAQEQERQSALDSLRSSGVRRVPAREMELPPDVLSIVSAHGLRGWN